MSERKRIQLTDRFWQELEDMGNNGVLPLELARHLREVIHCHYRRTIQPMATASLIAMAKEHLSDGIVIHRISSEDRWQLLIYTPDNPETHRTFFVLAPNYPYGQLKRLSEIEAPINKKQP
jgi:hypothetical protein